MGQLEGHTDLFAKLNEGVDVFGLRAREQGTETGRGGDERSGLIGQYLEVVLDGVFIAAGSHGFAQLAQAQALKGLGLQDDRFGAQTGDNARGPREKQVRSEEHTSELQ